MSAPNGDDEVTEPPPPDTDQYIYRPVTKLRGGEIVSDMTQIWISQP